MKLRQKLTSIDGNNYKQSKEKMKDANKEWAWGRENKRRKKGNEKRKKRRKIKNEVI